MKILFIGNIGSSAWNFKKGLSKYKDIKRIDLMFDPHPCNSGNPSKSFLKPNEYDIVHFSYPIMLKDFFLKYQKYVLNAKVLVCHWRGTDIRGKDFKFPINLIYRTFHHFNKQFFFKRADFHIYATYDLGWFLREVPAEKRMWFETPTDTSLFKDYKLKNRKGKVLFQKGARGFSDHKILHSDMPKFLNKFKYAEVVPAFGIDPHILQNAPSECLACGLKVKHHEDKDRAWVIKHRGLKVSAKRLYKLYKQLLRDKQ